MTTAKICSGPQCERKAVAKGLCSTHYRQKSLGQELKPIRHWQRIEKEPCIFPGCEKPRSQRRRLCSGHNSQHVRGHELTPMTKLADARIRDEQGRKRCSGCHEWFPEGAYSKAAGRADGLHGYCFTCTRHIWMKRRFNITPERYESMVQDQGGMCANQSCRAVHTSVNPLSIDHDHDCCPTAGESCGLCIRGLLCRPCNTTAGTLLDDPGRLRGLADYLSANKR
jgi:hypothetical protein